MRSNSTSAPSLVRRAATGVLTCAVSIGLLAGLGLPAQAAPTPPNSPTLPPGSFSETNLAADRTAANFFYRIPALTYLGNDVVLAAWDGRPGSAADAPNPNSIVQRRSTDGGKTWGPVQVIAAGHVADASGPRYGYSDPSYIYDAEANKVFAFFVYSKDQGFGGSQFGNDDADRNVISSAVIESSDAGVTWSQPRLITSVTKPGTSKTNPAAGDVRSNFASSGEGIQLKYGPHKGRLIQQYAGDVRQADGSNKIQAYSVYSDDHGVTWHKGANVGDRMDENKTVELSDGRVLLNSRDNANQGYRKVAVSTDGGATYGPVSQDTELPDPANNGAIARMFPNAAQGSADAKKLIFTNANSKTGRENVSARVSCDDGATWPGVRTIRPGFSAYSTVTRLADGKFGVLYEGNYTDNMPFATFDDAWLNYVCAPLAVPAVNIAPSATQEVPVTVTNQEATTLSGATATVYTPSGWSATTVPVPDVAPGASVTVTVALTAPADASGPRSLNAAFTTADGRVSQFTFTATTPVAPQVGLTITGSAPARDVAANPYQAGDVLGYTLNVKSTANVAANSVPLTGTFDSGFLPPAAPNCRYNNLAAGASYNCTTAKHTITAADMERGYFVPEATFSITSTTTPSLTKTVQFTGAAVALRDGLISADISGARTDVGRDLATRPYAAGELVPYAFTVKNTSPFVEQVVPTAGNFSPFLPAGAGNCRYLSLPAGQSYECATPRHAVTAEEVEQGFFVPDTTWEVGAAGQSTRTYRINGGEVDLLVRDAALSATVVAEWKDADGDRFASAGDPVTFTYTVGNAGNVALTGLEAPDAGISLPFLAPGDTATATREHVLTAADVAAGSLAATAFEATARNGSKEVAATAEGQPLELKVQPVQPSNEPELTVQDLEDKTPPFDLGTAFKYRTGQKVSLAGLEYGQWYYVYLNKTGYRLGWMFPTTGDTVEFILPPEVRNGRDDVVVLDKDGRQVSFDRLQVTPKGEKI
ncbi:MULTISPECIES: exo-alpha-sialidase [Paenarthrobacter]|uniref:exo-alpha-sialidase n=1 Tax=Paenarthrobacter ureafaciens TaxID=37931 RepID=A0AAX3EK97_PAEUR|nr:MULTISPECIES: exo-alpha-sialidase [Paenarthrobacter]NKR11858.1 sialidase [Arthrobacter sp. M5]NKR15578.1 sialidase [Arthrobacter sp. M6]OEH58565.1 sialidase [Arthrobacter sp. D4]OEH64853.1 sialidase [Arthrobacter sp. D2]MDO5863224.1 exo-alpha-sialidase [Paenarthrobacter sp. SD-2]